MEKTGRLVYLLSFSRFSPSLDCAGYRNAAFTTITGTLNTDRLATHDVVNQTEVDDPRSSSDRNVGLGNIGYQGATMHLRRRANTTTPRAVQLITTE